LYNYDATNGNLKYVSNKSGSWNSSIIDQDGDVGKFSSIAVDSEDNARITYRDATNLDLKYAQAYIIEPEIYIKANGSGGPLIVSPSDPVNIAITLNPNEIANVKCDWWAGAYTPFGTYWYNSSGQWQKSDTPVLAGQYPLVDLSGKQLIDMQLPVGPYMFSFILDDTPDGIFDMTWYDSVNVFSSNASQANRKAFPTLNEGLFLDSMNNSLVDEELIK
jgi:hypothetical protein